MKGLKVLKIVVDRMPENILECPFFGVFFERCKILHKKAGITGDVCFTSRCPLIEHKEEKNDK